MPKYRKLPLTVIDSLDMADMPDDFTRLTWLMLPLIVCKHGRAVDLPQWLVSKLYPARTDVDAGMIAAAMDWYESRQMIRRYEVDGRAYFELVNWAKHQGDTSREGESPYPDPPPHDLVESCAEVDDDRHDELLTTNSRPTPDQLTTNSRSKQRQSKGNSKGNSNAAAVARANGASAENAAAAAFLKQFDLSLNGTTARIVGLDPDYIRAHLDHARKRGEKTGLAIRRMIDGDALPLCDCGRCEECAERYYQKMRGQQSVPLEYQDIIKQ